MLIRIAFALLVASAACRASWADELTPGKSADIRRLMDVTGSVNIGKQFAAASSRQLFQVLRTSRPEIPDRALAVMENELLTLFSEEMAVPGGLLDQLVPVYAKYFTQQEIRELLAFYQTPIGQKAILALPQVLGESMGVGQRWGQSLGPEIQRRVTAALNREGLLPKAK